MREDKLSVSIVIRILISLLPILFGMPTVAMIFCAYNIVVAFLTSGPLSATIGSLCALLGAMLLSAYEGAGGEIAGLAIGAQAVLSASGCIVGLFKQKNFYNGLILSTLGVLVPQFLYVNSIAHKNGISLAQMLVPPKEEIRLMLDKTVLASEEMKSVMEIGSETLDKISEIVQNITTMIIPSSLIISSMITAYIVMWVVAAPLRKMPSKDKIHSFAEIKMPRGFVVLTVLAIVLLLAFSGKINSTVVMVVVNMIIVTMAIALFSGISLLDYFLRKVLPFKLIRIIIHTVIALNFLPVYILAAFLDSFANFRKLARKSNEIGGEDCETEK